MKKISVLAIAAATSLLFPFLAQGATATVVQSPMTLIATLPPSDQSVTMAVRGSMIYLVGSITGVVSTDAYVQALNPTGEVKWSLPLDSGGNDIATAVTLDSAGNIWVVGSSQPPMPPVSLPSSTVDTSTVLNPDTVTVQSFLPMRGDLTSLDVWQISPAGELLSTQTFDMGTAFLVRDAIYSNGNIAVVGIVPTSSGNAGFFIQSDEAGNFGKLLLIGKAKTEINSLIKGRDGSLNLLGASSEKIGKTKVRSISDGIIVTLSASGKITSLIRSFNSKSARSWQSGTSSFFTGGDALTSGKSEAVVTKYASDFRPLWTTRFPGSTPALTVDSPKVHFLTFASTSSISGLKRWKPNKPQALTLGLDAKGALIQAYGVPSIAEPMAVGYTKILGVVLLGRGDEGVSIFHALPR